MRDLSKENGFTLIEALVAMAIFTIGFSGIYLFFNYAQQVVSQGQKRMYMNLLAGQIAETIAAQASRKPSDPLNPFSTPSLYAGDISNCTYSLADIRQSWCLQLIKDIGMINTISGKEARTVSVTSDGTGLIVDVVLIADDGVISIFYTRKLRQK